MQIVMPLAGRGSRFIARGIKTPKPLLEIRGKPMIKWATDTFPFFDEHKYIFLVRGDHIAEFGMDKALKKLYPNSDVTVVSTNGMTQGAACTVLLAKDLIDTDEELIIYNPDQHFSCPLEEALETKDPDVRGMIPVFYATHPKWSYVRVGDSNIVTEVREKEPISTWATSGLYYFSYGKDFVWAAEQMIEKNIRVNNDFYICPTYNELLGRGDKVVSVESEFMWGLGTPEEVEYFEKYYKG